MISKIRKYQDSWLTKGILFLTAMSFMSLFGISGYVGSAGKNKPVVKVGNLEVLQGDFSAEYNKQLSNASKFLGDNIDDSIKTAIAQQLINNNLNELVIIKTADKLDVSISDDLIRRVIFSIPDFAGANGRFDANKMKQMLYSYNMSENELINKIRLDIKKQHLVEGPVENINVPNVMAKLNAEVQRQQRVFQYIKLDTSKTKIDREISEDEVQQYYQDFIEDFTMPETRDVEFMLIDNDEVENSAAITDEEIDSYYKEHKDRFETPEKRNVLQMVLENEEDAIKAKGELDAGKDFFAIAKEFAKQENEDTDFGLVSKDMLADEISNVAFSSPVDKAVGPIQSEFGWHIIKVTKVELATKTNFVKTRKTIIDELRKEKSYEAMQDLIKNVEDSIGLGSNIEDLAKQFNGKTFKVVGLSEDGKAKSFPTQYKDLVASNDFTDTAFSYNIDETSQIIETNDGIVVLVVKNVVDAHPMDIKDVRKDIEKIWAENERSAIVQETVNNVMNDAENGDSLSDIASRFKLTLKKTSALKRNETFEGLTQQVMTQLFQEAYDYPKLLDLGNIKMIVVPEKVKSEHKELSNTEIETSKVMLKIKMMGEYSQYMINNYSKDYKVKIDYDAIGLGN